MWKYLTKIVAKLKTLRVNFYNIINIARPDEGYALIYVLFINLLIISALLSFLCMMFFYNMQSIKILSKTRLDWACYSAAQLAALDSTGIKNRSYTVGIDSLEVNVTENLFGLYIMVTTSAKYNNDSSMYQCLFASAIIPPFANALTISHPNATVTIAGQTHITGNISLTSNNISKGNIFGIRNSSENYLDGDVLVNDSLKPNIFKDSLVEDIFNLNSQNINQNTVSLGSTTVDGHFLSHYPPGQNYIINGDLIFKDSLINNDYRYYYFFVSGKTLFQDNCYSTIKMFVRSGDDITLGKNSVVENSLLLTNRKIITDGTYVKYVQMYSKDSVSIMNSYFSYPSTIVSYASPKDSINLHRFVSIKSSTINGTVMLLLTEIGIPGNKSKIYIDDQSKIQGLVYSQNNIESFGNITGSVYTYNYWFYKDPGEYVNWLVNTSINRVNLDKWFLIPCGFKGSKKYEILDGNWIY